MNDRRIIDALMFAVDRWHLRFLFPLAAYLQKRRNTRLWEDSP